VEPNQAVLTKFFQGTSVTSHEIRNDKEEPRHPVQMLPFCMQSVTVTVEQYCGLFDPGLYREYADDFAATGTAPGCPVIRVNWWDAFCFALWIGAELPTESQWEFACRAGHDGDRALFGIPSDGRFDYLSSTQANFRGNASGNSPSDPFRRGTVPARHGEFKPNAWNLWQMHGNVWEWTRDIAESYAVRLRRLLAGLGKATLLPLGEIVEGQVAEALNSLSPAEWSRMEEILWVENRPAMGVVRGGGWRWPADYCRSAFRIVCLSRYRGDDFGFRVVVPFPKNRLRFGYNELSPLIRNSLTSAAGGTK
jgi:formylglycine-generating enzyme required for sulfatase activity